MESRMHSPIPYMATTTVQLNPRPIAIECYEGQVQELTEAITQHSARLRRIALRHLGNLDDADDAVQDAILSALKHIEQFRGQAMMSTWLTAIVVNSARMKLRQRLASVPFFFSENNGEENLLEELVSDTRPTAEEVCFQREFGEIVDRATSRLPLALRTTFQLRNVDGLSIREIAEILGVPIGTVKARLARARVRLRRVMRGSTRRRRRGSNPVELSTNIVAPDTFAPANCGQLSLPGTTGT